MRTRSQARRRRNTHIAPTIEPVIPEPEFPMADQRTMAQRLQAPTGGYEPAIVSPPFTGNFIIKDDYIKLVSRQSFSGNDDEEPHAHIRMFESLTQTIRYPDVPNTSVKLILLIVPK